jgi:hypothetical protein
LGSKIGLVLAVFGGALYIIAGVTNSVSQQLLNMPCLGMVGLKDA